MAQDFAEKYFRKDFDYILLLTQATFKGSDTFLPMTRIILGLNRTVENGTS